MAFVRASQSTSLDSLTMELHAFLSNAGTRVGEVVTMNEQLAERLDDEVPARSADDLLQLRKRERAIPADILALHLG